MSMYLVPDGLYITIEWKQWGTKPMEAELHNLLRGNPVIVWLSVGVRVKAAVGLCVINSWIGA